jgi:hypothetical protein
MRWRKIQMKRRKGFAKIVIDDREFLFNWADVEGGPILILYDEHDRKIEIQSQIWGLYPDSKEYLSKKSHTWHGKHKKGAEWAGWGKREAREMYRKYIKHISS